MHIIMFIIRKEYMYGTLLPPIFLNGIWILAPRRKEKEQEKKKAEREIKGKKGQKFIIRGGDDIKRVK